MAEESEISVTLSDFIATVEIQRPPNNFFDFALIRELADTYERLDDDADCRVIVLAAKGKHFCAGADFGNNRSWGNEGLTEQAGSLYVEAVRLFRTVKPVVAAVQGAAIGGGLGLALSADFRVSCEEARFCANFARLGFHQGFGLSVTLPRIVGQQVAAWMLLSGERIKGARAHSLGLVDRLVAQSELREEAVTMAGEIARSGPLAVRAIRNTLRHGLADEIEAITRHELALQDALAKTDDFAEGVRAMSQRETPSFTGC